MGAPRLKDWQKEIITSMYREGAKVAEIMAKVGVCKATVVKHAGAWRQEEMARKVEAELQQILRLKKRGLTYPEIAAKLGLNESAIQKRVERSGRLAKPGAENVQAERDAQNKRALALYLNGASFEAIARRTGINRKLVGPRIAAANGGRMPNRPDPEKVTPIDQLQPHPDDAGGQYKCKGCGTNPTQANYCSPCAIRRVREKIEEEEISPLLNAQQREKKARVHAKEQARTRTKEAQGRTQRRHTDPSSVA